MSSVSLGNLYWSIETRLQNAEDSIRKVDQQIVKTDEHWERMKAHMSEPLSARVNMTTTGGSAGMGGGAAGHGVGAQLSTGGAGSSILPPANSPLDRAVRNPIVQAAYVGNPAGMAALMARQYGVSPDQISSIMGGGGQSGGGAANQISAELSRKEARQLHIDAMEATKKEDLRADRVAKRDALQMQKDFRQTPLSDYELRNEQISRMNLASMSEPETEGGTGGGGGGGGVGMGNFLTRRLPFRGMRYSAAGIGLEALNVVAKIRNIDAQMQTDMALAGNDQNQSARIFLKAQRDKSETIPILGSIGFNIRDALEGVFKTGNDTASTNLTLGETDKALNLQHMKEGAETKNRADRLALAQMAPDARNDPIRQKQLEIAKNLEDANEATRKYGEDMRGNHATELEVQQVTKERRDISQKIADTATDVLKVHEQDLFNAQNASTLELGLRHQGLGHDADRLALEQQYDEKIAGARGSRFEQGYRDQKALAIQNFDDERGRSDDRLTGGANSENRAAALEGAGSDFAAQMERMQEANRANMIELQAKFGVGPAEYKAAGTRYDADQSAAYAKFDRSTANYTANSASSAAVAGFNARGDTLGAKDAELENERRRRLAEEVPAFTDPRDVAGSQKKITDSINADINAQKAAAKEQHDRSLGMYLDDQNAHAQGNAARLANKPITGDVIERFDKFATEYNNVQGSDEDRLKIRTAMATSETGDLKLLQKQLTGDADSGHATRIEAGQTTHRQEDTKHFQDMAAALKSIEAMLKSLSGGGGSNINLFTFQG